MTALRQRYVDGLALLSEDDDYPAKPRLLKEIENTDKDLSDLKQQKRDVEAQLVLDISKQLDDAIRHKRVLQAKVEQDELSLLRIHEELSTLHKKQKYVGRKFVELLSDEMPLVEVPTSRRNIPPECTAPTTAFPSPASDDHLAEYFAGFTTPAPQSRFQDAIVDGESSDNPHLGPARAAEPHDVAHSDTVSGSHVPARERVFPSDVTMCPEPEGELGTGARKRRKRGASPESEVLNSRLRSRTEPTPRVNFNKELREQLLARLRASLDPDVARKAEPREAYNGIMEDWEKTQASERIKQSTLAEVDLAEANEMINKLFDWKIDEYFCERLTSGGELTWSQNQTALSWIEENNSDESDDDFTPNKKRKLTKNKRTVSRRKSTRPSTRGPDTEHPPVEPVKDSSALVDELEEGEVLE
ncbi:hypothetical protein HDU93_006394 [Gonapodya sp. JEL0774]|nr:hypothetical protein HDU93_006394 [Gonapodya sp. JEL0774]